MIYFIRDEATQHIKIGFTAGDGEKRRSDLQAACPGQLVLLLQMEGSRKHETAWHERFSSARERGEWFRPVPKLLQAIEDVKASQAEAIRRRLQKLQEEINSSGVKGWSTEELEYLRLLQWEEDCENEGG